MPASITQNIVSVIALSIQLLIFVYLYASHRVRFFRYLVGAWGLFVGFTALRLTRQFFPEASGVGALRWASMGASKRRMLARSFWTRSATYRQRCR